MNKLKIKKLGVLSVAKIYAVIMLVMSLIISIPYGLFIVGISLMGASAGGSSGLAIGGGGAIVGILMMFGIPILYGAIGFVAGAIGALLYNLFAGIVGGIEIEVENVY
ncbi:MAG: hypothetical protein H0V31_08210 [Acidobacteria bacterium]|nr:hypothetical protein [Acidobacteriota bacterium]